MSIRLTDLLARVPADVEVKVKRARDQNRSVRAKGLDPGAVEHMSLRVFNRKPDALTRDEASNLIRELSNLKRRVA